MQQAYIRYVGQPDGLRSVERHRFIHFPGSFSFVISSSCSTMTAAPSRLVCRKLHYPPAETVEIRKNLFRQALQQLFEPFAATEIFLPDHRHKNFAIISFSSTVSAEQALAAIPVPHFLFEELKEVVSSHDPLHVNRDRTPRNEQQQRDTVQRLKQIMDTPGCIDFILQCTKSHADRIQEIFTCLSGERTVQVKGCHHVKDVALLFCQASHPALVVNYLHLKWYIQDNVQRIYMLRNACSQGAESGFMSPMYTSHLSDFDNIASLFAFGTCSHASHTSRQPRSLIRVEAYPPRIHSQVLNRVEDAISESNGLADYYSCTPDRKVATHTLSVLELVPPSKPYAKNGYYVMAYTSHTASIMSRASPPRMVGYATCRAYWKLAEAVERYRHQLPPLSGGHGMDVGASPGGWTQYLIQSQSLSRVYSIDPGALDSLVLALPSPESCENGKRMIVPAVRHIQATYLFGIPQIAKERCDARKYNMIMVQQPAFDWYVSDMCVKTLGEQIDALLLAVQHALVVSGTFIVLTLKCTRGHSKATFDAQVECQVDRIRHLIKNLHVMHLFSNRSSERTIMGYWK